MEFPFDLSIPLKSQQPVACIDREFIKWTNPRRDPIIPQVVNEIGLFAAKLNGLRRPTTSYEKLVESEDDQRIYLLWRPEEHNSVIMGYARTVLRRLYLMDSAGRQYVEIPICILDFFIYPTQDGGGDKADNIGNEDNALVLFNKIIEHEKIEDVGKNVAFDKPSEAFLAFLNKHFVNEVKPVWQSTNILVFETFFENRSDICNGTRVQEERGGSRRQPMRTYDGKPPPSTLNSPRACQRDSVGDLILFGSQQIPVRERASPNTPQGRKNIRDFGHQNIW